MEALAAILGAVSWPVAAVVIVLLLRSPILGLIPSMSRPKYKDFEIEFGSELAQIKERADAEAKALPKVTNRIDEESSFLDEIRNLPPRTAILEIWLELEHTLLFVAQQFERVYPARRLRLNEALKTLQDNEIVLSQDRSDIDELRRLRNIAVHERDINIDQPDVERYADAAMRVADVVVGRQLERRK